MSRLSEELQWRGLIHQVTDDDVLKLLDAGSDDGEALTAYIGFDPTADSLHVGSLLQLCTLRRMQLAGHRAVALAGGGTGMIGDPGGRSEERNLLDAEALNRNLTGIRKQLERFIDFSDGRALLVNNGDWLWSVGLLDFLRDIGKHFTVNQMVAKESVKARFESREHGISFTEFSYMLLQAYDFLMLFDQHGCRLQLGGSDQWGNITMGVELIRKMRGETAFGLTSPLVLKADGTKFGKTESGAVWLDADKTSPYDFFQFWINVEDSMVGAYLRYFTWLSREEIEALDAATRSRPERREAHRALAFEVTKLVHGEDAAEAARAAAEGLFAKGAAAVAPPDAPTFTAPARVSLIDLLVAAGLCSSKSDARRTIDQGGAYINNEKVGEDHEITAATHGDTFLLRRGKKHVVVINF